MNKESFLKSSIKKNIMYAFGAQLIAMLAGAIFSLLVPKILNETQFAYWQLFVFYTGYVGFAQLGLQDGMYLRMGGKKYEEIDRPLLNAQLKISIFVQTILGVLLCVAAIIFMKDESRIYVVVATMLYMLLSSVSGFIGYIFQATNLTLVFSRSVIIDRLLYIVLVIVMIILRVDKFEIYVICFTISKAAQMIYCIIMGREIVFSPMAKLSVTLREMKINISVGIKLMLANIASIFILGICRALTDQAWGIEKFGKISFALTLTSLFLTFITQFSMVLFPALRRLDDKQILKFYETARNLLTIITPIIYVAYIPFKLFISAWLPEYSDSIYYMGFLLPIALFDGKMSMLCSTYFKVLRKERFLLFVNVITLILSTVMSLISIYIIKDILAVVLTMVIAIVLRSVISEIYLAHLMKRKIALMLGQELLLTVIFIVATWECSNLAAFLIYLAAYIIYLFINHKKVTGVLSLAKDKIKNRKNSSKNTAS